MALHLREDVMAAFTTKVTGLTTTGSNVTRGRAYTVAESDLPHLTVYQGDEEPVVPDSDTEAVLIYAYYMLRIIVEIRVNASSGILETNLNLISKEISDAINADVTLGVVEVQDAYEIGHSQPEITGEKDKRSAQMDSEWVVKYKRSRADATA